MFWISLELAVAHFIEQKFFPVSQDVIRLVEPLHLVARVEVLLPVRVEVVADEPKSFEKIKKLTFSSGSKLSKLNEFIFNCLSKTSILIEFTYPACGRLEVDANTSRQ